MPKVVSLARHGLDLWFNSDDHLPPHFHAEKPGDWEVRVYFLRAAAEMFEPSWSMATGRPNKSDLKALARAVEANREALLTEWEAKVSVKAPGAAR